MSGLKMKYFVLKPEGTDAYAEASRKALRAYGRKINQENPELASDLISWADSEIGFCELDDTRNPPDEKQSKISLHIATDIRGLNPKLVTSSGQEVSGVYSLSLPKLTTTCSGRQTVTVVFKVSDLNIKLG